jgi:hypothetical protein
MLPILRLSATVFSRWLHSELFLGMKPRGAFGLLGRIKSSAALTAAAYVGRAARVRTMNAQPSRTNLLGTETHQRRWLPLVHAESDALAVRPWLTIK